MKASYCVAVRSKVVVNDKCIEFTTLREILASVNSTLREVKMTYGNIRPVAYVSMKEKTFDGKLINENIKVLYKDSDMLQDTYEFKSAYGRIVITNFNIK